MLPPESPVDILKVAVVGTGVRAQAHLSGLAKTKELYRLCALCDAVPGRAEEVGKQYGVPGYQDVDEMIRKEKPDVVLVVVPPEYHHTVSCQVMEHGAHVLCETPIAITLPYADAMIRSAAKNKVKLEVGENVWRFPQERLKQLVVASGMIGEVRTVRMSYRSGSYHGINAVRKLVNSRPVRISGRAKITSIYMGRRFVDPYLFNVLGPRDVRPPSLREESTWASWEAGLIEFENGVFATYEFPITVSPGNHWELEATAGSILGKYVVTKGPDRKLEIVVEEAEEGGVKYVTGARLYDDGRPVSDAPVWENPVVRYKPENAGEVAVIEQLVSIYRAATEGIEPDYGAANAREDMEILIAVRESARLGGQPITLPIQEPTGYEKRQFEVYGEP